MTVVTALVEQISGSEKIDVVDEESGISAELDTDYWSDGEVSKIKASAAQLSVLLADEANPPSLTELAEISERKVASLDKSLTEAITLGPGAPVGFAGTGEPSRARRRSARRHDGIRP